MKRWLWAVWWLGLVAWSVALTTTFPVHIKETLIPVDPAGIHVAKVLHVCAYAFLAAFAGWLRPAGKWRWLIILLLLEHGVATEWIQAFVPERILRQRHRHRPFRRTPGRRPVVAVLEAAVELNGGRIACRRRRFEERSDGLLGLESILSGSRP